MQGKIGLPKPAELLTALKWNRVERGCAPILQVLFVYAYYLAGLLHVLDRPDRDQLIDVAVARQQVPVFLAIIAGAVLLTGFGLWLRRRRPDSFLFQLAASQFYCLAFIWFGYLVGPQSFAAGIVMMGAVLTGYVLLDRRIVLIGVALAFPILFALAAAAAYGLLPYAPLLRTPADPAGVLFWTDAALFVAAPHLLVCTVATVVVIHEWRRREAFVTSLGLTDALTQVHNRRSILGLLDQEVARQQQGGPGLAVALLDLDHFKCINDRFGHGTGDRALLATVALLRRELRPGDAIGRFGGEEFLLLLPATPAAEAQALIERCRAGLTQVELRADSGEHVPLTGSFGLACSADQPPLSAATLVRCADDALYRAKQGGRNRVELAELPAPGAATEPSTHRPPLRSGSEAGARRKRGLPAVLRHLVRGGRAWPPMARVILALALIAGMYLSFAGWVAYALHRPDRARLIDVALMERHLRFLLLAIAGAGVLLAAAVRLYRRRRESRAFQFVVMQYYTLSLISMGYFVGMLSFPAGIMLAGSPLIGLIFFEMRIVLWSLGVGLAVFLGYTYAGAFGVLPYAPLIAAGLSPYHPNTPFWMASYYIFVLPTMAIATMLADQTLGRWRQRGEQVAELSRTDALTAVHNRRSILRQLDKALAASREAPVTVALLDLDHFKRINDTWGHPAGDRVLQEAAAALKDCLRQTDAVGRYGGEEFLMVLPATALEGAAILAERCRQRLAALTLRGEDGIHIPVTGSFGLASSDELPVPTADALIHLADAALYRAKAGGRNRVEAGVEPVAVGVAG